MKPTLVSHFYNEDYLMPWWLEHHKDMFDHGIMIDYSSTDNSVDIIKEICPHWEIRQSRNQFFGAREIDAEVEDINQTETNDESKKKRSIWDKSPNKSKKSKTNNT